MEEIVIRKIRKKEIKKVSKLAKVALFGIKSFFVINPNNAMVALINEEVVGGIIYKIVNCGKKKIAYISNTFVDIDYQNKGIGKKLYNETINYLNKKYNGIIALVREDNIVSSKLFKNSGLIKVSFIEIIKSLGIINAIKCYCATPFFVAVGHDFYMLKKKENISQTKLQIMQFIMYFVLNLILALPIWLSIRFNVDNPKTTILAYLTILILIILIRYMGFKTIKEKFNFRINEGGMLINLVVSFFGFPYLVNGNFYLENYVNQKDLNEKLARPELIKWFVFLLLPFLYFTGIPYFKEIAHIGFIYLILFVIPFYPFSYFGGRRIYNYSKKIWLMVLIITFIVTIMMKNLILI